jgi:hypothetical protein
LRSAAILSVFLSISAYMRLWRPNVGSIASMRREIGRNSAAVRSLDLPLRSCGHSSFTVQVFPQNQR